jgi:hypothetical protein
MDATLNAKFNGLKGSVFRDRAYAAGPADFVLSLTVRVPMKTWNAEKKKGDPIDRLHLVVDLSNFLYRSVGFHAYSPSVGGLRDRCKNGFKTLTFEYRFSGTETLKLLGLGNPQDCFFREQISLGPISGVTQLKVVGE